MIVAELLGGNEIKCFEDGIVIINGEELKVSYYELVQICGNISLGELDTSVTNLRPIERVQRDYIGLVRDLNDEINAVDFVIDNHLTAEVSFSSYEIDFENKKLVFKIDTFE